MDAHWYSMRLQVLLSVQYSTVLYGAHRSMSSVCALEKGLKELFRATLKLGGFRPLLANDYLKFRGLL